MKTEHFDNAADFMAAVTGSKRRASSRARVARPDIPRAGTSEHDEQVALFQWAAAKTWLCYDLYYLYAIPNAGAGAQSGQAGKMKAEGVKAGYPDIGLDVARGDYHGLRIEMKVKGGRVKAHQQAWHNRLADQGYKVCVCWNWIEAARAVLDYLGLAHQEFEL